MKFQKVLLLFTVLFAFAISSAAQTPTPTPDEDEKVFTEEIKLNILAFDRSGKFASGVTKDDLVIIEDGRIHQAESVRRIPANVLILLDVGNENPAGKNKKTLSEAAIALVNSLQAEDSIAVIQYADNVEFISEWTTDKTALVPLLKERKLGQGVRSVFYQALDTALKFFQKSPLENRHLVLITDGIDSFNDAKLRESVTRNLLSSDINVHILSYTEMAKTSINVNNSILQKGEPNPRRVPEEVLITLPPQQQDVLRSPRIGSINTDREMMKKRREMLANLKKSEEFLTKIAADTNGDIFLPQTTQEFLEKIPQIAKIVDASYVVTYIPKRPLSEVKADEERVIEVISRREGLQIQARRKLFVSAKR